MDKKYNVVGKILKSHGIKGECKVDSNSRFIDERFKVGNTLYIKESYFALLTADGRYQFKIVGTSYSFSINVDVVVPTSPLTIDDLVVEPGNSVNVYVGKTNVTSLKINGAAIEANKYYVKDYTLHIDASCFSVGENEVVINDNVSFKVTINNMDDTIIYKKTKVDYTPVVTSSIIGGSVVLLGAIILTIILVSKKRRKKDL